MQIMKMRGSLAALAILSSGPGYAQASQSALEQANEHARSGKPEEALALVNPIIDQAMLKEAKDPGAMCPGVAVAALQAFMEGNFTVTVENDWCDAMMVKAYSLIELGRTVEAEQVLERLIGHNPHNPQYLAEYAHAVRLNGDVQGSLDHYKKVEKLASRLGNKDSVKQWRAVGLRGQGYAFIELGRWDDALKAYRQSLKYDKNSEIARNQLQYIAETRPR